MAANVWPGTPPCTCYGVWKGPCRPGQARAGRGRPEQSGAGQSRVFQGGSHKQGRVALAGSPSSAA
jgi:hypothetical protein